MRRVTSFLVLALFHGVMTAPVTNWVTVTAVTNSDGSFYDPTATTATLTNLIPSATPDTETTGTTLTSLGGFLNTLNSILSLFTDDSKSSNSASSSGGWSSFFLKLFGSSSSTTSTAAKFSASTAATIDVSTATTTSASNTATLVATAATTEESTASANPLVALGGLSSTLTSLALTLTKTSSSDIYADIYDSSEKIDISFAKAILDAHNKDRALHGVGDLLWAAGPYSYAKNNADNYDCSGILTHTHGQYGENLAAGFKDGPSAVAAWYEEGETYNYQTANEYNHFTQVIWKGSTQVGCAYKDCTSKGWGLYIVCEYSPVGNVIGQNLQNVLPLVS